MTLWSLFWLFFYIGLFTVGGGQVAITLMHQALVDTDIINAELFYNMLAVSESTPGPIGINMATYLGTELFGVWGGIITTLGTVSPSVIVIVVIARFFGRIQDTPAVKNIFTVLRPAAAGLICIAAWNVFKISVILFVNARLSDLFKDGEFQTALWQNIFYFPRFAAWLVFTALLLRTKLPPVVYITGGAAFGLIFL